MLNSLELKWNPIEIVGKTVFYEKTNLQTVIPFKHWDREVATLKTATACLFGEEEPATEEMWSSWLSDAEANNLDLELDFSYKPTEFGNALRADFDEVDQTTMVLVLDRTGKYWILATFDDLENGGFQVEAAMENNNLNAEEAFPYLMALYYLKYYSTINGNEEEAEDFADTISRCTIVVGISPEAIGRAVELATAKFPEMKFPF